MGSHSFCANLTHFVVGSHSSDAADRDLDRSAILLLLFGAYTATHYYTGIVSSCVRVSREVWPPALPDR